MVDLETEPHRPYSNLWSCGFVTSNPIEPENLKLKWCPHCWRKTELVIVNGNCKNLDLFGLVKAECEKHVSN